MRTHRFLNKINAGLQVETEVNEAPLDALPLVLLLLQDEHGVVEELLQLLVGVVDTELLKGVQLEGHMRQKVRNTVDLKHKCMDAYREASHLECATCLPQRSQSQRYLGCR